MEQNIAAKLIDQIGHDTLKKLGLSERNLRHVRSTGRFAAQWYMPVKEIAERGGIFCPMDAFSFKSLPTDIGIDAAAIQDGDAA